ncbi:tripartite tricarboxylate transporter substrate binding protein [Bradyrhizobium sp. LHD-71]|uniref:Bug family tripartite tricarboxylate transporter substrate binding protein n=1 Tax=Bradyrhizobium sp. LHD-71 TaxID=3072141 RepID=UPI00281032F7|nr:tripartite tricarboxylate transporter substrate binding protein [Bradyrhizobium sp. LHD-71]MDQ8728331.1 tripartite tricarboxylate transporter substrate binding protein [Bradyrhizobium sp. LHD-71]
MASLLVVFALCGAGQSSLAQDWPQQTVRIVVPFPAGSGIDAAARIISDSLAKRWKQPVVIENKPGSETTIGAGTFAATRDGHTLLYTTFGTLSVAPLTVEKLPFDPEADLVPLVPTVSVVVAISVTTSLAVQTLAELEAVIRARKGQLAWASSPTLPRYVFATFLKQRGLEMNYVAYRDASQPQMDLGEGRIHAFIAAIPTSAASVAAGKARFIATTEPRRTTILPDVPSAAESGYGEFTFVGGAGLFGWRDMPHAIRERVVSSVNAVLSDPAVTEKLKAAGQQVIGGGPEALRELVEQQRARVLEISRSIDLKSAR